MSGHSKWSTIKHQKAANDAKRGKLFSKLAKDITVAAREGGSDDPASNAKLRLAMEKAREANMPKENVKRAIERGVGKGGLAQLETIVYEGFGPEQVAIIVESLTDNRNRSNQEVKGFFDKQGGQLASLGAVGYLFERQGQIVVEKKGDPEEQMLALIDCGAEDIEEGEENTVVVLTASQSLHQVTSQIEAKGFLVKEAELVFRAKAPKIFSQQAKQQKIEGFLDGLDDLDDVQRIFTDYRAS
jgi:YebC/PmpR family DNA-binding regulatory protein